MRFRRLFSPVTLAIDQVFLQEQAACRPPARNPRPGDGRGTGQPAEDTGETIRERATGGLPGVRRYETRAARDATNGQLQLGLRKPLSGWSIQITTIMRRLKMKASGKTILEMLPDLERETATIKGCFDEGAEL